MKQRRYCGKGDVIDDVRDFKRAVGLEDAKR
jgi:hypothetical protein